MLVGQGIPATLTKAGRDLALTGLLGSWDRAQPCCVLPRILSAGLGHAGVSFPETEDAAAGRDLLVFYLCRNEMSNLVTLKQYKYSPGGQKSDVGLTGLESRCQQGYFPFGSSRGEAISSPFPASSVCPHSLACGLFLLQRPQRWVESLRHNNDLQVSSSSNSDPLLPASSVLLFLGN